MALRGSIVIRARTLAASNLIASLVGGDAATAIRLLLRSSGAWRSFCKSGQAYETVGSKALAASTPRDGSLASRARVASSPAIALFGDLRHSSSLARNSPATLVAHSAETARALDSSLRLAAAAADLQRGMTRRSSDPYDAATAGHVTRPSSARVATTSKRLIYRSRENGLAPSARAFRSPRTWGSGSQSC